MPAKTSDAYDDRAMRPDPEYIKRLLTAFQDSPDPATDINELEKVGLSITTPELYFHPRLLNDQDFVRRDDDEPGYRCFDKNGRRPVICRSPTKAYCIWPRVRWRIRQ